MAKKKLQLPKQKGKSKKVPKNFKAFIMKGNVLDYLGVDRILPARKTFAGQIILNDGNRITGDGSNSCRVLRSHA